MFSFQCHVKWVHDVLEILVGGELPLGHGTDIIATPGRAEVVGLGLAKIAVQKAETMMEFTFQYEGLVNTVGK